MLSIRNIASLLFFIVILSLIVVKTFGNFTTEEPSKIQIDWSGLNTWRQLRNMSRLEMVPFSKEKWVVIEANMYEQYEEMYNEQLQKLDKDRLSGSMEVYYLKRVVHKAHSLILSILFIATIYRIVNLQPFDR